MLFIGWDVGIKNLSYCIIEYKNKDYKIKDWNIIDLTQDEDGIENEKVIEISKTKSKPKKKKKKCSKISLKDLSRNLYRKLEENKNFSKFDYVIIENQPVLKNPTMKSIQMILYSYFSFKSLKTKTFKDLILMNASNKLKVYKGEVDSEVMGKIEKLKSKYNRNKKISILHTKLIVSQHKSNSENWSEFFDSNKKKDDLADSFLMILYYLKKNKLIE